MAVTLVEAILEIHEALERARLPHAFGGALALAWCTGEPRATRDVDVNVFIPPGRVVELISALPRGIAVDDANRERLERDGQDRLMWGAIPIDLFLSNTSYHEQVAAEVRYEAFAGAQVPFLSCASLAVFKAFFDREKDWVDLAEMLRAGQLDAPRLLGTLTRLLGPGDERVSRLVELLDRPEP